MQSRPYCGVVIGGRQQGKHSVDFLVLVPSLRGREKGREGEGVF
jgi:hypothetical protein